MKLLRLLSIAALLGVTVTACTTYESDIADLNSRISKLETLMDKANSSIEALQKLTEALNKNVFVSSVNSTDDGYEIVFSDGTSVKIKDGVAPVIGVAKHQGVYYWTVDGEWLLDDNGKMLPVSGIAPQLKIEDNWWYISTDGGATWEKLEKATSESESIITGMDWDDNYVYITLKNGDVLTFSRGANGVQAICVAPDYQDGSVNMSKGEFPVRFDVLPAEAAESVAALDIKCFALNLLYTQTKATAGEKAELAISEIKAEGGQIVIKTSGSSIDGRFFSGKLGASACLSINDGVKTVTTGYFPLYYGSFIKVRAGDSLQDAIDNAKSGDEIRVEAGARFNAPIYLWNNVRLSGGWINDFTTQDLDNRSIIDGKGAVTCVASGWSSAGRMSKNEDAVLSGFEVRNGGASGIVIYGKLTVEYCWIHNCSNSGQGGGICCTEQKGDELMLANSILEYNKADAHGGAVAINGQGTKITVVNCLFRGNASIAQYGYTGAIHGQAGVQAFLCNNTIVDNGNWRDGSSATATPWSVLMYRNSGTHVEMVNNIVAGNWYFLPGVANDYDAHPDRYDMPIKSMYKMELQVRSIDLNEIGGSDLDYVCRSNVLGGTDKDYFIGRTGTESARTAAQAACTFVHNNQYSTIFVNASGGDFRPQASGPAGIAGENSELVKSLLGPYTTDLAGKPRATNGKIYAGCYQP